jgi:hypothetical protein
VALPGFWWISPAAAVARRKHKETVFVVLIDSELYTK